LEGDALTFPTSFEAGGVTRAEKQRRGDGRQEHLGFCPLEQSYGRPLPWSLLWPDRAGWGPQTPGRLGELCVVSFLAEQHTSRRASLQTAQLQMK